MVFFFAPKIFSRIYLILQRQAGDQKWEPLHTECAKSIGRKVILWLLVHANEVKPFERYRRQHISMRILSCRLWIETMFFFVENKTKLFDKNFRIIFYQKILGLSKLSPKINLVMFVWVCVVQPKGTYSD